MRAATGDAERVEFGFSEQSPCGHSSPPVGSRRSTGVAIRRSCRRQRKVLDFVTLVYFGAPGTNMRNFGMKRWVPLERVPVWMEAKNVSPKQASEPLPRSRHQ
jgi:hypothetical protein